MSSNPAASFLDFFVLEAGEYVERLDALLLRATDAGPDSDALQRAARALRGSATMAKLPTFAELASSVEAVGRALRDGSIGWEPGVKGALTAAIDDLKILVRAARAWSPAEDQWARQRVAELGQFGRSFAPVLPSQAVRAGNQVYFANECNNIASGLDLVANRPDDRTEALSVLQRVRAARGVAGVTEVSALSAVLEATEGALRAMEQGEARLSPERVTLLRSAANLLRAIAGGLTGGEQIKVDTPQYRSFLIALDAVLAESSGADRVIPIADLFYNDPGPHIVSTAPNPPTTPIQRFRMEVVSLGEHLHRVIEEARRATDEIQREHARGQLGRALRAIRATAASFGQMAVAQTVEAYLERTGDLNVSALDAISSFAATISPAASAPTPAIQPAVQPLRMSQAQRAVANIGMPRAEAPPAAPKRHTIQTPVAAPPAPEAPAAAAAGAPAASSADAPAAHARVFEAVHAAATERPPSLDQAIAAFDSLSNERFAEPAPLETEVLPVDALLYRGRAALDRAMEIRDELRRAGGQPAPALLEELYDLVELARVD
jgi:chemotaxis protein histidine kinase CheA